MEYGQSGVDAERQGWVSAGPVALRRVLRQRPTVVTRGHGRVDRAQRRPTRPLTHRAAAWHQAWSWLTRLWLVVSLLAGPTSATVASPTASSGRGAVPGLLDRAGVGLATTATFLAEMFSLGWFTTTPAAAQVGYVPQQSVPITLTTGGEVIVHFEYTETLCLGETFSFHTPGPERLIYSNYATPQGQPQPVLPDVSLGTFPAGTTLAFDLHCSDTKSGDHTYFSDIDNTNNADLNRRSAEVTQPDPNRPNLWQIRWEDHPQTSFPEDHDWNDLIVQVGLLEDDTNTATLQAAGTGNPESQSTPDPVNTFTGSYFYSRTDVALAGRGPAPAFTRAYNSADTRIGRLGPGWTTNLDARLVHDPGLPAGDIVVVRPDGRRDHFALQPDGSYTPPWFVGTRLVHNTDGTYTATEPDQTQWSFDGLGGLRLIVDRFGNQSKLTYRLRRVVGVSDPAGRGSLSLAYDANGRLQTVTDWANRSVTYAYDAQGRLASVTDRNAKVTTFGYDGTSSRLTTITDANGHVAVTNQYDPSTGRVTQQWDALGSGTDPTRRTDFTYGAPDASGNRLTTVSYPVTSADPSWRFVQQDTYDAQGRITQRVSKPTANSAEWTTVQSSYDAAGRLTAVVDPRGNTTRFCYDIDYTGAALSGVHGNVTRTISPPPQAGASPLVALVKLDTRNNPTQVVPPKGVNNGASVDCTTNLATAVNTAFATDFAYDASGAQLLSVTRRFTDPELGLQTAVTRYEYGDPNNPGRVTRITPPRGNTGPSPDTTFSTTFAYFGPEAPTKAGLLKSSTDALGNTTTYDYDAAGRRTSMVDPLGNSGAAGDHTWTFAYDNEDRLTSSSAPAPAAGAGKLTTTSQYDVVGNRSVAIDANGQVTKYLYDGRDSLAEVQESPSTWTDPALVPSPLFRTQYAYDNLGNLQTVTRAVGLPEQRVTDYAHDGLGRLRTETQHPEDVTQPATLVTTYSYDTNGNRTAWQQPNGTIVNFGYDAVNRLVSRDNPSATWSYDAGSNRTSMVDPTGTTTYSYDERDRLLSVATPDPAGPRTVGYRYDLDGNRRRVIYPDATTVNYTFDKASRLTSLLDWANRSTTYAYFPDGRIQTVNNFNGTSGAYTYDNARRLTQLSNVQAANTISRHTYTLDAVGNRTQVDEVLPELGVAQPSALSPADVELARAGGHEGLDDPDGADLQAASFEASAVPDALAAAQVAPPAPLPAIPPRAKALDPTGRLPALARLLPGGGLPAGAVAIGPAPVSADEATGPSAQAATASTVTDAVADEQPSAVAPEGGDTAELEAAQVQTSQGPWTWGFNGNGELGNGTTTATNTPGQLSSPAPVRALGTGHWHSLALKSDGTVWAWGANTGGQLGDGTTTQHLTPTQVGGLSGVVALAGGWEYTLALRSDGTVWAWGYNGNGQLGQGDLTQRLTPVQVKGPNGQGFLTDVTAIATRSWTSLAIKRDGTVWAWGYNAQGQVGDGTVTDQSTPVQVVGPGGTGTLGDIIGISAGKWNSLALRRDGTVWAWGWNGSGQLGDGTTLERHTPVQVAGLTGAAGIASGESHSLVLKTDGTVWGWGFNGNGELGDGTTTTPRTAPVRSGTLTGVIRVTAGVNHSLALTSDGSVWGWGWNGDGELGDGTFTTPRLTPVRTTGLGVMGLLTAGSWHGMAAVNARAASTSYGYDRLYRLTSVTAPTGPTTYTYDPVGNRLSRTRAGSTKSWSYDKSDRLSLSTGATTDNNGNITIYPGFTYSYDAVNRLTNATGGGYVLDYSYDGDGHRTHEGKNATGGGAVLDVSYVDDVSQGLSVVLEERRSGVNVATETRKYVWGAAGLAYMASSLGNVDVYHTDGLGSVRAISDASAQVVQTYATDEFGVPTDTQGSLRQGFQWTGEERDENDLVFLRARSYLPDLGRFLQRDPLPKSGPGVSGWNRYAYVGNNPVSRADPTGLAAKSRSLRFQPFEPAEEEGAQLLGEGVTALEGEMPQLVAEGIKLWEVLADETEAIRLALQESGEISEPGERNIAAAVVKIAGEVPVQIQAVSGESTFGGLSVGIEQEGQFWWGRIKFPRYTDSEAKVLEYLAARLPTNATGTVRLFTERTACLSCTGVIAQFEQRYPGIDVKVFDLDQLMQNLLSAATD